MNEEQGIIAQDKVISPWGYFGMRLLFLIPAVGLICLIIFSFVNTNLNRRNFARSYWIMYLFVLVVLLVSFAILYFTGTLQEVYDLLPSLEPAILSP